MTQPGDVDQQELDRMAARLQPSGVTQAMATFEAVEQAYFRAVAAAPPAVVATSYATTTAPR